MAVAGWEVVANLETRCASCTKWGGRQFRVALLPTEIPASREPGLRLNPQLRRIPAEMRAELTSAEIAMSGSYFDDVLRDPRRYGIENTPLHYRNLWIRLALLMDIIDDIAVYRPEPDSSRQRRA